MAGRTHPTQEERDKAFRDFDPNRSGITLWAVWDGRTLYVKPKRGGCLTKLRNTHRGKLYELTLNGWVLHATKDTDARNDTCDLCGLQKVKEAWEYYHSQQRYYSRESAWAWERQGGKIASPPRLYFLCPACKQQTGWY